MTTIKKRNIIIGTVVGVVLVFGIISSIKDNIAINSLMKKQPRTNINAIPIDYLGLFKDSASKHFSEVSGMSLKSRNPVVNFRVDSVNLLTIYRVPMALGKLLNEMVQIEERSTMSVGSGYEIFSVPHYKIYLRYAIDSPVNKLYVGFDSHVDTLKKSSDMIYYNLEEGNFSLRYTDEGAVEFYTEKSGSVLTSIDTYKSLLLLRKNDCLYFLLLASKRKLIKTDLLLKSLLK